MTATSLSPTGSPPLSVDPDEAAQRQVEPIELKPHNVRTNAGDVEQQDNGEPVDGRWRSRVVVAPPAAFSHGDIRTSGNVDLTRLDGAGSCRDPTHAEARVGIATPICSGPPRAPDSVPRAARRQRSPRATSRPRRAGSAGARAGAPPGEPATQTPALMCGPDGCWVAWVQPPAGEGRRHG